MKKILSCTHPHFAAFTLLCAAFLLAGCGPLVRPDSPADVAAPPDTTIPMRVLPGPLVAVEAVPEPLPRFDPSDNSVQIPGYDETFSPMLVLLSRERYWMQDGHLDVVVRLEPPGGVSLDDTRLSVTLRATDGRELSAFKLERFPHQQLVLYPSIPPGFEGEARLALDWTHRGESLASEEHAFRVERFDEPAPRAGRVSLEIPNAPGAAVKGFPVTVGVPFPRGALYDTDHVRLVDERGREVPLQVKETGRWSKFGSLRWVLCDFTVDLDGGPRRLALEYGPDVRRRERAGIDVDAAGASPVVDAGRVRIDDGLWFDSAGDGRHVKILEGNAFSGAFVEHADGRRYGVADADGFEIEEAGSEKVVLKRTGWYRAETGAGEFCQFITRVVIHHDSPIVRIFHTWIYTGDDREDRIRNMGWAFPLAAEILPRAFLSDFDEAGWHRANRLLQWDYEHYSVGAEGHDTEFPGGRAPGVAAAASDRVAVLFGVKDFWQNYPSELEFRDGAFWFYNWPRRNRPAGHTFDKEWLNRPATYAESLEAKRVESASAARYALEDPETLAFSEWVLNIIQHRYAHEGEMLDFRLPARFAEPPLSWSNLRKITNAQGISRTEEMWIYLRAADEGPAADAVPVLQGLNDETLRAVVDPEWVARSDAFHGIHHRDPDRFPEEERSYELAALSWDVLTDRLGIYGMWIFGDLPAWDPSQGTRTPNLTRAFQKQHLGWPYSWIPFARSGDPRLLKIAEANTRRIIDSAYCHYVGGALEGERTPGYWGIGPVYWHSEPHIKGNFSTVESFLHAWHLTGYHRAADHIAFLSELFKTVPPYRDFQDRPMFFRYMHGRPAFGRGSNAELKMFLDLYKQTFDPWFLAGAHAISRGHLYGRSNEMGDGRYGGRIWDTGDRDYLRFTGETYYRDHLYLDRVVPRSADEFEATVYNRRSPQYTTKTHAWWLTGDPYYLRRIESAVQSGTCLIGDGERYPYYHQGVIHRANNPSPQAGGGRDYTIFTGRHLKWFPVALRALADASERPDPITNSFMVTPPHFDPRVTVTVRKERARQVLPLHFRAWRGTWMQEPFPGKVEVGYSVTGSDGTEVLAGTWDYSEGTPHPFRARGIHAKDVEIPADAPAGVYTVEFRFSSSRDGGIALPITGRDVPEVVQRNPGSETYPTDVAPFWFRVPEGVARFSMDFRRDGSGLTMVWDPDGRRVWNQGDHYPVDGEPEQDRWVRAEFEVAPEHAGRLWRVTGTGRFRLDPELPAIFAVEPRRWFDPGE